MKLPRSAILIFLVALTSLAGALFITFRSGVDARRHGDLLTRLDAVAEAESSLDRDLLKVVAGVLSHYDTVMEHSTRLRELLASLDGMMPLDADKNDPLALYRTRIAAKLDSAERIKGSVAFLNNETAYLPFAVADYVAKSPSPVTALRLQAGLIGLLDKRPGAQGDGDAQVEAALSSLAPGADAGLRSILLHMRTMKEQRDVLHSSIGDYFGVQSRLPLESARTDYLAGYSQRQYWVLVLTWSLLALSVALFCALGIAIRRLDKAHRMAQRARNRLVDAVNSLHDAFALFDSDRRLIISNRQYDTLFERQPGQASAADFYDGMMDGLAMRSMVAVDRDSSEPGGQVISREMVLQDAQFGTWRMFRSRPTGDYGVVCLITDITEQKGVETQLRKLTAAVEQSPLAIVITDDRSRIEYVNPRFLELTGYGINEVLGSTPSMLKSGETPPEVYNELWRTITAGLTWRGELVNRKKNGDLFWENVIISPVRDDNGRLTHFIALKEDITHRKRNEEMLIDTNADIERMLFAASHDLQEPVRSIVTFSQLLQREAGNNLNERAEASLGFILEATKQLHLLIKGLVDYSRSTRPVAAFVPVNCATVVQRAIADCRDMAPQAAPIIDVGELPTIMGDPVLLMMLFVNLIGNAIKYAREGVVPTIKVSASQDGTGWRIAIADNGIGIEADYLKDLIRPFSRLHSRSTHPGAGLGLASSQKIAKTHGGRLWLSATPGHGTTAFLWLPAMSGRG